MLKSGSFMQESVSAAVATLFEGDKIRSEIIAEQVDELYREETRCLRTKPTREPSYKFFKNIPSPVFMTPVKTLPVTTQASADFPSTSGSPNPSMQKSRSERLNASSSDGSVLAATSPPSQWAKRQVIVPTRVRMQSHATGKSIVQIIREELYPTTFSPLPDDGTARQQSGSSSGIKKTSPQRNIFRSQSKKVSVDFKGPETYPNDLIDDPLKPVPTCKYKFYDRMRIFDLIVSVEYCNCCSAHHKLGHDESQFEQNALLTLLYVAQQILQQDLCCRLGVVRIPTSQDATSASAPSSAGDPNSAEEGGGGGKEGEEEEEESQGRTGAFEVQLAYKTPDGEVIVESIHSKIVSGSWPAKDIHDKVEKYGYTHKILTRSVMQDDETYYFSDSEDSVSQHWMKAMDGLQKLPPDQSSRQLQDAVPPKQLVWLGGIVPEKL